jgi:hypothetical protein
MPAAFTIGRAMAEILLAIGGRDFTTFTLAAGGELAIFWTAILGVGIMLA